MKFLCFNIWTAGLLLCVPRKLRGNPNVGDKLEIVEDNDGSNSAKGDSVSNSTDIINSSDVTDILARIETISSRLLSRTVERRQRLIVDQAGNKTKPSSIQTQEFQLIFLNKDLKVPLYKDK